MATRNKIRQQSFGDDPMWGLNRFIELSAEDMVLSDDSIIVWV